MPCIPTPLPVGEHVLQTLSAACKTRIKGAGPQVLATMAWALAHLQHKDRQLLAGIADELINIHHPALEQRASNIAGAAVTAAPGQKGMSWPAPTAVKHQVLLSKGAGTVEGASTPPAAPDVIALTGTAVALSKLGIRHPRLLSTALVATCAACNTATGGKSTTRSPTNSLAPGAREVAPLLWALAVAQHPCSQEQLLMLVNALGWQDHHNPRQHNPQQHRHHRAGCVSTSAMDPGLVSMALMALPRLGCDPGRSRLAAAGTALQGRAGRLSTHTLCELVAAFAELQVRIVRTTQCCTMVCVARDSGVVLGW
jgi:hypothetical protein